MAEKQSEVNNVSADTNEQQGTLHRDPALQTEHQHHHAHHHHSAFAEQGREDEVIFSKDPAFEKGIIPDPSPLDHGSQSHSQGEKDEETGEANPAPRPLYRRAMKHWRPVFHAAIWILFTG